MAFNQNDPELEQKYYESTPIDAKDVPPDAIFIGTVEILAFTVEIYEIYEDGEGMIFSCVQEK